MAALAFVDTETTGLDVTRHEVWEIAVVVRGHAQPELDGEWLFVVHPEALPEADPMALTIGGWYARGERWLRLSEAMVLEMPSAAEQVQDAPGPRDFIARGTVARWLAILLADAVLIGSNPGFDAAMLARFLRRYGQVGTWHYRPIDVVSVAAGGLGVPLPWKSEDIARRCGVEPAPVEERHTALGDARWVQRWWDVITADGFTPPTGDELESAVTS